MSAEENVATIEDRIIWRQELMAKLDVCSETVRIWMKNDKLPPLDVNFSQRKRGWKASTLRAAGVNVV